VKGFQELLILLEKEGIDKRLLVSHVEAWHDFLTLEVTLT